MSMKQILPLEDIAWTRSKGNIGIAASDASLLSTPLGRIHGRNKKPIEETDNSRKRTKVACGRCRKRKIKCSGPTGENGPCLNCKNVRQELCQFTWNGSVPAVLVSSTDYPYATSVQYYGTYSGSGNQSAAAGDFVNPGYGATPPFGLRSRRPDSSPSIYHFDYNTSPGYYHSNAPLLGSPAGPASYTVAANMSMSTAATHLASYSENVSPYWTATGPDLNVQPASNLLQPSLGMTSDQIGVTSQTSTNYPYFNTMATTSPSYIQQPVQPSSTISSRSSSDTSRHLERGHWPALEPPIVRNDSVSSGLSDLGSASSIRSSLSRSETASNYNAPCTGFDTAGVFQILPSSTTMDSHGTMMVPTTAPAIQRLPTPRNFSYPLPPSTDRCQYSFPSSKHLERAFIITTPQIPSQPTDSVRNQGNHMYTNLPYRNSQRHGSHHYEVHAGVPKAQSRIAVALTAGGRDAAGDD